ncbi:MAG: HDOD domain-containing protein [Dehalococcoidia bacterium]|nr:HDOD domain-containing protein [Dehalococcoidia bacterium]
MSDDLPATFEARNRLRSIVNRTQELTPLRAVASKAIQMAEDERSAAMDLATVLSSDQALTARLLRLSNSAYYGYARRISNVREAVVLLGMRTVRSVAITSGIIDALKPPAVGTFSQDLFWAHSVCVGLASEALAREFRTVRPDDAFTAGVLHDVGRLAMMLVEPGSFAEVLHMVEHEGKGFRDAELLVFGVPHEQVGASLAERWKFPMLLVDAIGAHHPGVLPSRPNSAGDIVAMANFACDDAGLSCGYDRTGAADRETAELPGGIAEAMERAGGIRTIEGRARAFLLHVTDRAPRWYESGRTAGEDEPMTTRHVA